MQICWGAIDHGYGKSGRDLLFRSEMLSLPPRIRPFEPDLVSGRYVALEPWVADQGGFLTFTRHRPRH